MRIGLFISGKLASTGGAFTFESQLLQAILELAPMARHTFVFCTDDQNISRDQLNLSLETISFYQSPKFKTLETLKAIFRKLRYPRSKFEIQGIGEKHILKLLNTQKIDLNLFLGWPKTAIVDVPYITIVWDLQHRLQPYFPEVSRCREWDYREDFYSKILRRATFIITGTKTGKSEIQRFYHISSERIKVVPFFTPQLKLSSCSEREILNKYNIPNQYLFYPAQFWPHKNHIGLLLAVKTLREKYALDLPLVLVGSDKGNKSYVETMARELDLSSQVHFLGFVPQEDMVPLYSNAFALTFTTFFGPDNLPPLEAMSLGCPVIASNVPGAKEQLGDGALLVDPKKPEEIAGAIKLLWEDGNFRQDLIKKGLARSQKWTVKDYAQKIFSIIDEFEAVRRCWS